MTTCYPASFIWNKGKKTRVLIKHAINAIVLKDGSLTGEIRTLGKRLSVTIKYSYGLEFGSKNGYLLGPVSFFSV